MESDLDLRLFANVDRTNFQDSVLTDVSIVLIPIDVNTGNYLLMSDVINQACIFSWFTWTIFANLLSAEPL